MYFPVADIEVPLYVPPLVAFAISVFSSMGGVSGAFMLVPFQMSALGYSNPSLSATNQFYNVVAIPGGVYRYIREGRMVWPLTITVAAGTLPGVLLGALARIVWMPDAKLFKPFVACVLLFIGARLFKDLLFKQRGEKTHVPPNPDFTVQVQEFSLRRITYSFQGQAQSCPTGGIFCMSLVVGMIGGAYGIGGGSIIAPFLVSWFGLPVHTISGATLMGTFLTSVTGVIFYEILAPFFPELSVTPDWLLGLMFGLGGALGMYCGSRLQKYVSAAAIKWMLSLIILGTALKYVWDALA